MGPTASGKTALSVQLALRLGGELINADSRQAIAELRVGVCKPTAEELCGIPCHGLDWRALGQPYSAALFAGRAREAITGIWARGRLPIVVGGTGLYVRALLTGFDFGRLPPSPAPSEGTVESLRRLAPDVAARVDLSNPRRVERALALARAGRRPTVNPPGWSAVRLAIEVERPELRRRIESRAQRLVSQELADEVSTLRRQGWPDQVIADSAIGYREALAWVDGRLAASLAAAAIASRTWRYARAQLTWLRSEPDLTWVAGAAAAEAAILHGSKLTLVARP